jgi:transposase-like protein
MGRSKIQFQKGLSLFEFQSKYGNEEQCRKAIFKSKWPRGWVCPRCGSKDFYSLKVRYLYQCKNCRHQTSLISGTIFSSTKIPLTIWFLAIFFITQSKEGIAALNLRRFLGISDTAALRMKHKLQLVMKSADDKMKIGGLIQIDDVYWGGKSRGGKRGRGAPGKSPFVAALSRNTKGHPVHIRLSRVKTFSSEAIKHWADHHLNPKSIVISDGLGCFRSFEDCGHIHGAIITGDGRNPEKMKPFVWLNTIIGNVKNSIRGTYHGVSKKHLSLYLAEFSFRFNRRFNLDQMVPALISFSVKSKPIPHHQLRLAEDWS